MDPPDNSEDYDDLAWMLIHESVVLHVGEKQWDIVVKNKCRYLDIEKGCLIYDKRPGICRNHVPGECDANARSDADYDGVDSVIKTLEELYEHQKRNQQKVA